MERVTPYEMVFDEQLEAQVLDAARAEADAEGVDPRRAEAFALLKEVGRAVRAVVPPDAPPEALQQYRMLLFHAFHFREAGRPVYAFQPAVARYLVETVPDLGGWELRLPERAVYLRFPSHLFWSRFEEDAVPEAIDGAFVCPARDAAGAAVLEMLLVLGLRPDRAGFSVIPVRAPLGPDAAGRWNQTPGRDDGPDFANMLPGGELGGLYSVRTTAEALKLVARMAWYLDRFAVDVVPLDAPERPVRLHRVALTGPDEEQAP